MFSLENQEAKISSFNPRAEKHGDDTITDTASGLMWSKATLECGQVDHATAEQQCTALTAGGHTDWRLPTVEELFALADRTREDPAIDTDAFPDTKPSWYWSSTITAWNAACAWIVAFDGGYADYGDRSSKAFVRAVRVPAGQYGGCMRQATIERPHPAEFGGVQKLYRFANGYGASVVQHQHSYGGDEGMWELAVIRYEDGSDKWRITYDTEITDDVLGYLSDSDVDDTLSRIEALPSNDMVSGGGTPSA